MPKVIDVPLVVKNNRIIQKILMFYKIDYDKREVSNKIGELYNNVELSDESFESAFEEIARYSKITTVTDLVLEMIKLDAFSIINKPANNNSNVIDLNYNDQVMELISKYKKVAFYMIDILLNATIQDRKRLDRYFRDKNELERLISLMSFINASDIVNSYIFEYQGKLHLAADQLASGNEQATLMANNLIVKIKSELTSRIDEKESVYEYYKRTILEDKQLGL